VLLDIAADRQFPSSLGIAAWHPSVGLSFLVVLLYGPRLLPLLFLGPFIAELVSRGSLALASLEAISVGSGYAVALVLLRRPDLRLDMALTSLREVFVLMAVAILSSALVSAGYIGLLVSSGFLAATEFSATALAYWVGDMVGIAVVTPFGLLLLTRERPIRPDWRIALQVAIIVFALAVPAWAAWANWPSPSLMRSTNPCRRRAPIPALSPKRSEARS
jgi:two-component system sensor kinase FixL